MGMPESTPKVEGRLAMPNSPPAWMPRKYTSKSLAKYRHFTIPGFLGHADQTF